MSKLLCYTRKPIDNVLYDPKLAYSMHLAVEENGRFEPLNHNSGVLFVKATENEDGSLNPKSIRNPYLFAMKDGSFGVLAVRQTGTAEKMRRVPERRFFLRAGTCWNTRKWAS